MDLDLFVNYEGKNYTIFTIGIDRKITEISEPFHPYFYVSVNRSKVNYFKNTLFSKMGRDILEVEETDLVPLVWANEAGFMPAPGSFVALKVSVTHPSIVPKIVRFIERNFQGENTGVVQAGAANVKFDVRCGFDLTRGFITNKDAIALLPAEEMASEAEKVLKIVEGLKVAAFDIEVDARGFFPGPDAKILSVSYVTVSLGETVEPKELVDRVTVLEGENSTVEFARALAREGVHAVAGYNSYNFDVLYLYRNLREKETMPRFIVDIGGTPVPHFDLFLILENLRGAMKVRSHGTHALDDVTVESGAVNPNDPFVEEMLRVEEAMDRTNIGVIYESQRDLFLKYAKYDVVLTALLAQKWLPAIYMLASLSKIPPSMIQFLNTGQLAEYLLAVYWLEKLGFAPTMRRRNPEREFKKIASKTLKSLEEFYGKGKVYVRGADTYRNVLELDFDQLYPTIYSAYFIDPAGLIKFDDSIPVQLRDSLQKLSFTIFLGRRDKKSADYISTVTYKGTVAPIYGPLSPVLYNLYRARAFAKKLKKQDKRFDVVDQAIKIFNNSVYGGFSKERGNLLNEAASAYIFYKSNQILYDVISYVDTQLNRVVSERFGADIRVAYGDTDSIFVAGVPLEAAGFVEASVNTYVRERFGELFSMKREGYFDLMLVSRRKHSEDDEALRKSYLLFEKDENGRLKLVEMKGIFYKIEAPAFIKERRSEIFEKIVVEELDRKELSSYLLQLARETAERRPHLLFYHKVSALELRSEEEPRLKRLNRVEHFAMLYRLYLLGIGKKVESLFADPSGVTVEYNVAEIEEKNPIADVYFIPLQTRGTKSFLIYVGREGNSFKLHRVKVGNFEIVKKQSEDGTWEETGYKVAFSAHEIDANLNGLINIVYPEIEKFITECSVYIISNTKSGAKGVSWFETA